jgi:hypothetical protein
MTTLLKVLNNLADIKSAGGVALRVRTQARSHCLQKFESSQARRLAPPFGLPRPPPEGNMAQDLIADQDIGKNVAIMRGGEVFRDDTEGARVAIVLNDYLYDLNGVLVGHLKGRHVIDANTRSTPIGFRKLLEGKS